MKTRHNRALRYLRGKRKGKKGRAKSCGYLTERRGSKEERLSDNSWSISGGGRFFPTLAIAILTGSPDVMRGEYQFTYRIVKL